MDTSKLEPDSWRLTSDYCVKREGRFVRKFASWPQVLSAALLLQLSAPLWSLLDADGEASFIAAIALAQVVPLAGLALEVLLKREICTMCAASVLGLVWALQMALLVLCHACGASAIALICGFGAAVLLFVVCPMVVWPAHRLQAGIHEALR